MDLVGVVRILSLIFVVHSTSFLTNADRIQDIDEIVSELIRCRDIPGLGLSVVLEGKTVIQKGYGLADVENNVKVTEKTLFAIASVSKQMSSTLLAILLKEKGKSWNTPIKEIVKDFELDSELLTNITTVSDVLGHRTGITSNDYTWLLGNLDRDQLYKRIKFSSERSTGGFRDQNIYNNVVFTIASKLSEKLGGKPWETLMREKLFQPLGMTSTTFYDKAGPNWTNFAKAYVKYSKNETWSLRDMRVIGHVGAVGPAGSISSNAEDMAKYLQFLVSGGETASNQTLLTTKELAEVYYPTMALPQPWFGGLLNLNFAPFKQSSDNYARGWALGRYRDHKIIFHPGNLIGHDGLLTFIPGVNSAIYSTTNGPSSVPVVKAHLLLHRYLTDLALGETPWLNKTTVCTYPEPWGNATDFYLIKPFNFSKNIGFSRAIDDYLGQFGSFELGNVSFVKNSEGRLQMNYGLGKFILYPKTEKDVFYVEALEPYNMISDMNSRFNKFILIKFNSSKTNELENVHLFIDSKGTFVKNLKMSDVPKKTKLICDDTSGAKQVSWVFNTLFLVFCVLVGKLYLS